jgi:hypothetical protein
MAKKKKSQKSQSTLEKQPSLESELVEWQLADLKQPAPAPEAPAERTWNVHDAARQMIKGYKDQWWPSIHAMAKSQALGEDASESECRACFLKWGATLK